jgi:predicted dehydrogenase
VTTPPPSRPLRHVVIGVGAGVLAMHRPGLELDTTRLAGVSDLNVTLGRERAEELGCAFYADYRAMLAELEPEVAVVLTPHPFHAAIAGDCLRAGAHVLVEKPMAVEVAEADAMIAAAEEAGRLLAVSFQQRCRSEVRAAKRLLAEGALGRVQHLDMTLAWPRTKAYYASAGWRATWRGEGGGVLMNQAPHNLDLIVYLLGSPRRVVAWTRTLLHAVEVEDTVQAMLEWGPSEARTGVDGALGSLHISTAEAGRPERLEIVGTAGRLMLARDGLHLEVFETDFRRFVLESAERFAGPASETKTVSLEAGEEGHLAVYRNLHEAVLLGTPLVCNGTGGRGSLELANAMIYSSHAGREVELPLDRKAYAALLEELKLGSRVLCPSGAARFGYRREGR